MSGVSRIVVVEDSPTQAFKLRLLLEDQGWEVSIAGAAEAALAGLAAPGEALPDLILCDYHLPGMRGDEFCRRVRMNLNTRGLPILMMTASVGPETAEVQSLESGADGYVSKTEAPEILLLRIRALLRKGAALPAIPDAQDSAFLSARILAIDDSPTHLEFLSGELRNQGYEVETAESGVEGLRRLAEEAFDCVLVDLVMPGMDGIEVCRRIDAMRPKLNGGAVIILTSSPDKADLNRGLEAGADDFVGKSSGPAVLRARIQALMRRRFFQEENSRIVEELKTRELEILKAREEREVAQARLAMAEELVQANQDLHEANQKLKDTQAQLIQNEKMASLGQLVAGIAHEINNPLAFVVNHLFLVESGLQGLCPQIEPLLAPPALGKLQKVRDRLGEMKEGLDRVKELVLDLRTFSRLDEAECTTVDIVEKIDVALLLLKHKMNGRIVVEKHYAPERMLHCYSGRLRQVLTNLLANAADAIGDQGTIVVATSQTPEFFVISVRDNGAGIPENIRSRIFDPFFTTKPVGQGTGLGLAISYGILQDHGGSIEVQSKEGVGSEFIVKVPLNLEARNLETQRRK